MKILIFYKRVHWQSLHLFYVILYHTFLTYNERIFLNSFCWTIFLSQIRLTFNRTFWYFFIGCQALNSFATPRKPEIFMLTKTENFSHILCSKYGYLLHILIKKRLNLGVHFLNYFLKFYLHSPFRIIKFRKDLANYFHELTT